MKPAALLAWLLGLVLFGCLRSAELPDEWPCNRNQDCYDDKVCRKNQCVARGTCDTDSECLAGQACVAGRCATSECSSAHAEACGEYSCHSDNTCRTSCESALHCASGRGCKAGVCVPAECASAASGACRAFACLEGICSTSCETSFECGAEFTCVEGDCVPRPKPDGTTCQADVECASGVCCARTQTGVPECRRSCQRADLGGTCNSNLDCVSLSCQNGLCASCTGEECVALHCAGLECGMHDGTDCGACGEKQLCDGNQCVDACFNMECGLDRGVACGSCEAKQYCTAAFECADACPDYECGSANGVKCGECPLKSYCDGDYQCVPDCGLYECGWSPHNVSCGTCEGLDYCADDHTCQPACEDLECGPSFDGINCGTCDSDELCSSGQCEPKVCPPELTSYCKGNAAWWCQGGLDEDLLDACDDATEYCAIDTSFHNQATCFGKCTPDSHWCDENDDWTTCGDDGVPLASRKDCSALGASCTLYGCGIHTYDGAGPACTGKVTTRAVGDVYQVTKDVLLLSFGQYLGVANGARFFVYESSSEAGPYTEIASVDRAGATNANGLTQVDINAQLKAGKYYVLGATTLDGSDGSFCYWNAISQVVSFGNLLQKGYVSAANVPAQINAPASQFATAQDLHVIELK